MSTVAHVRIHASQFPQNILRDLIESLRRRRVNHKFHYDSVKQTQKWLALHQRYSPTRNDADCHRIYEESFGAATAVVKGKTVHVSGTVTLYQNRPQIQVEEPGQIKVVEKKKDEAPKKDK